VVTSGGIIGKINKVVDDNEVTIDVAEGVRMRLQRNAIAEVRAKGEPAKDEAKK
jgi:preprotein translocase subunit YajC